MALDFNDQSSNGNNLTNSGATEYTATHPFSGSTEAIALDGATQLCTFTPNAGLSPTTAITVKFWYKGTGSNMVVQNASFGAKYSGWFMQIISGKARLGVCKDTGTTQGTDWDLVASTTSINDGNWHHACGTFDGSNIKIYIDGNATAEATTAFSATIGYEATTYGRVGCENDTGTNINFLAATGLTDIRVLAGTAQTGAQNAADYNTLLAGGQSTPKAWWPFQTVSAITNLISGFKTLLGVGQA